MDREQVLFRLFGLYCPQGTILYGEGAPGDEAYLVQGGELRLSGAGEEPRLAGPGALVGEEAFLGRAPRTARVEAAADSRLLQVAERTIDSLARNGPRAAAQVVSALVDRGLAVQRELAASHLVRALRRVEPQLREAETAPVPLEEIRERGGNAALRLIEDLGRTGALTVAGGAVRVRDAAALRRAMTAVVAAGGEGR